MNHTTIDTALLATVNLLRGSKPYDRSAVDRHYAVTITMLEQAYAYFNTYVTRLQGDSLPVDIAPPTDCDALGRPSFAERHAANDAALDDIRRFVYGS